MTCIDADLPNQEAVLENETTENVENLSWGCKGPIDVKNTNCLRVTLLFFHVCKHK